MTPDRWPETCSHIMKAVIVGSALAITGCGGPTIGGVPIAKICRDVLAGDHPAQRATTLSAQKTAIEIRNIKIEMEKKTAATVADTLPLYDEQALNIEKIGEIEAQLDIWHHAFRRTAARFSITTDQVQLAIADCDRLHAQAASSSEPSR